MTLYHGSSRIIEVPEFGVGRKTNDFGLGFYCTEDCELAKEWAVSSVTDGFANCYQLPIDGLRVLNLNTSEYTILNWVAILLNHRVFSIRTPLARKARQYLLDHFYINVNAFDIIFGYRADDSYFDYAEAFVNNALSVNQLARAMRLGNLGEQVVVKSKYAFSLLRYQGAEVAAKTDYYTRRKKRNDVANQTYLQMAEEADEGLYILDILRGDISNDDPRISRNIP